VCDVPIIYYKLIIIILNSNWPEVGLGVPVCRTCVPQTLRKSRLLPHRCRIPHDYAGADVHVRSSGPPLMQQNIVQIVSQLPLCFVVQMVDFRLRVSVDGRPRWRHGLTVVRWHISFVAGFACNNNNMQYL